MDSSLTMLVLITLPLFSLLVHAREDTLQAGESIGFNQTLLSADRTFAFGFFEPVNNTNTYAGIWYHRFPGQTVIWVANRQSPLENSTSGVVKINNDGNLVILAKNGTAIWSSGLSLSGKSTSLVLLETGNLVLRDELETILWQSFDHPTDTYMFGMEFKLNLTTGKTVGLVSWKVESDPSGEYSLSIDPVWPSQAIMKRGFQRVYRWGPWSIDLMKSLLARDYGFNFSADTVQDELIGSLTLVDPSVISRIVLTPSGVIETLVWLNSSKSWNLVDTDPKTPCGYYQHCGPFSVCSQVTSPECNCLDGYVPLRREEWEKGNWSSGCIIRAQLACNDIDVFFRLQNMKLPDFPVSIGGMNLSECESQCLKNCSCRGYSLSEVVFGPSPRCLIWIDNMVDLQSNSTMGQDLYIRLASSELGTRNPHKAGSKGEVHKERKLLNKILPPAASVAIFILIIISYYIWKKLKRKGHEQRIGGTISDLHLLNFSVLSAATDDFSEEQQLGKGGFGPVYRGKLPNGQDIAVKRLSENSGQGLEEFKNEVKLIAKLQHKNLVKLLGWCIHGDEKILVYEFMPNKSLDKFLFDPTGKVKLDWHTRFHIAQEIAQGLLYLHRFSRLRVIHRDLKSSNILLDSEMNPKISDFGLARIFGGNQTEGSTRRVVGTYGYMAPEYALNGLFSEKSDVFSYGVVLLEIVTGKKSTGLYPYRDSITLLGYVWSLWGEDRSLELIDSSIGDSFVSQEVVRCLQVGLLCVQESPADRPNMSSVVSKLGDENATLPSPKQPGFFRRRGSIAAAASSSSAPTQFSQNELTMSTMGVR